MSSTDRLPPLVVHAPRIEPALAKRIRLVCFDVDGVLTDGGLYLGSAQHEGGSVPFELKRYDVQDGLGMAMLRECGLKVAIITGRVSESVATRARELRVDACIQDPQARKLPALKRLCESLGISLDEVAFVGDDLPDIAVLRAVGLPVAVGNCTAEAARASHLQLSARGGFGAVREFCELLLTARDEWTDAVERYVHSRSVDDVAVATEIPQ
ncbi:KdsC family phosphatase [Gemmatimonas sp.]|jgi:3-deoxy-D-manno-octulosonate 8-phosphate phosphatase (KDO 8-P phosphatase)|uniref:KdsC family phosphatase n=1 Tax=Gemmatimonas sp. TaxID=1962908 RepID=UPI0037BF7F64